MKILFENSINNKTLKETLFLIAQQLSLIPHSAKLSDYCVHHLDFDDTNNTINNLSLMNSRRHNSFHAKSRNYLTSEEKQELFNKEYLPDVILVGQALQELILARATEEEGK